MDNFKVYIHTNKINGKRYVGVTKMNVNHRWENGYGYRENQPHFHNAILKYGWDNFDHEIFADGLSEKQALHLEYLLILSLRTQNPQYGYNMTIGGEYNPMFMRKHSIESKKKMSKPRSDVGKQNIADSWTCERRQSMSNKMSGENNPNYGKFGASQTNAFAVYCPELNEVFDCAKDACDKYKFNKGGISMCVSGKRKTHGKHPITGQPLHWIKINTLI